MAEDVTRHDDLSRRCPRLGHQVRFSYCRTTSGDTVCPRVLDCWWERFDVVTFFREHLSEAEFESLARPQPREKVVSIVELIEQARKRQAAAHDDGSA